MKTFVKTFRGKMSYTKIDKYVDLVRRTLDPDMILNMNGLLRPVKKNIKIILLNSD